MSTPQPVVVRVTRRYAASPERVFDAFLDPDKAGRFMFATPAGEMVRVEIDARVGGRYAFVDRRDGDDVAHTGEYLEIDRPRRLVFTFSADGSEPDRVAIDVAPLEAGGCEVTLSHEMNPKWAQYADGAMKGWSEILDGLAEAIGE